MTKQEAILLVRQLQLVFDTVRLLDVAAARQCTLDESETFAHGANRCYAIWNKDRRCKNCISTKAFAQKTRLTKYEFIGNEIYHVVAKYIEVDNAPYVLEIVSKVTDEALFDAVGKDCLISAIRQHGRKLYTDSLSGAYNRDYFEDQLRPLLQTHALAMVDVDNFKKINDTYGHLAGDEALRQVVRVFQANIRSADTVIRYGGDEFLLVFEQMQDEALATKLEQLRKLVEETRIAEYPELRITVSMGGSGMGEASEGDNRIRYADERLYLAKRDKNTVCCR